MKRFSTSGRRRRGFTILELMLAIGIFALVLTAIYATWIAILRGSRAGIRIAGEVQRSRVAMRMLEDAFNSAVFFVGNLNHYVFLADTSGDMAAVSLAVRVPDEYLGTGKYGDLKVRRVSFYTQPGREGMHELLMTQAPVLLMTNELTKAYTLTLARDVTMFRLNFYDDKKREWLDEWRYTNQLPRLVQITLGLGKSGNNARQPYDLVTSLVALPSVAVQADIQGGGPPILPGGPVATNLPGVNRGLRGGTQMDPNNPGHFPNPFLQNPYGDPRFNRGGPLTPGGGGFRRP